MSDPQNAKRVADREAREWHVRLGERPVSAVTLDKFRVWRAVAGNADAYQRVEALWRSTGALGGDPDIQAITRDALESSRPRTRARLSRRLLPPALVVAGVLLVALMSAVWLPQRGVYETEVGGHRVVTLDDGSRIRLDTDSRIKVRYGAGERRIILEQGQALFTVAHDAARPFRVATGDTEVTALGTVFDVRREGAGIRVTLLEGAVQVVDSAPTTNRTWRLAPGQQIRTVRADPAPVAVDTAFETSWTQGRLAFRNTPLKDAVAEVNRYLPEKITLADGPSGAVLVNGVFASGDREAFVAAVSDLFGLTAEPTSDGGVRLIAPSAVG